MLKYIESYDIKIMDDTKIGDIVLLNNIPCKIINECFRGYTKHHKIKQIICKGIFDDMIYEEISQYYSKILYPIINYNTYNYINKRNNIIEVYDENNNNIIEIIIKIYDDCIKKLMDKISSNHIDIKIFTIEFNNNIRIINIE